MTRLIGHFVAAIERHSSQKLSLHPDAIQIKRHGEVRQTYETYWRTKQSMQDRSTDHEGALLGNVAENKKTSYVFTKIHL